MPTEPSNRFPDWPRCIQCDEPTLIPENEYGQHVCPDCMDRETERAWEAHCEAFHDGGSTKFISLQQQQINAQKLK